MPTTVAEVIEDTRRHLYGASRVELNKLDGNITDVASTLILEFDLKAAVRGSYICIDDEIMYVFDATIATKTLTVQRGYLGTIPAAHLDNALVEVNSRFPREFIKEALKREINSYGPRLFRVTAHDITITTNTLSYDMPTSDYFQVIDVRGKFTAETRRPLYNGFSVARDMPVADFPSGSALLLDYETSVGSTLRVRLARPFNTSEFLDTTDLEATVGMAGTMVDIPSLGAAWRLLATREIPRTNMAAQPEPRHHEEVPPGHIASVAQQLKRIRDERISEEQFLLREKYPNRIT